VSIFFIKHHDMETYWGGGIHPRILIFDTSWNCVVNFTPRPLYCLIKHHDMVTYWHVGIAPRIFNLGIRWRWLVSFKLRRLYPLRVTIGLEAGWASDLVWTRWWRVLLLNHLTEFH